MYGLPEWLSALQSPLLNESATLFRRRYYQNGSHAGFIMYMTDAAQKEEDVDALRQALKSAKGPGNFRNLFMYAPGGKKDGIQLLPVSEVAAKDEFGSIKNISRDDLLAACEAHGIPAGPINDMAQVFADPQIVHRGMQVDLDGVPGMRTPIRFSDADTSPRGPAPRQGGDS